MEENIPVQAPRRVSFANQYVRATMDIAADWSTVYVRGSILNPTNYDFREVIASNGPDRMVNYSGSGLPFPCSGVAFDGTPNYIEVGLSGDFEKVFSYPNSFYAEDRFDKITPSIFVRLFKEGQEPIFVRMTLPEPVPQQVRTLTHRDNRYRLGSEFYSAKTDIIGVKSAYDTMIGLRNVKIYGNLA
jgi:hypothetical protein